MVIQNYFNSENCSFVVHFTLDQTGVLFWVTRYIDRKRLNMIGNCFENAVLVLNPDMIMDGSPLVGFSAGGYSLSLKSLLAWYFHPFFQDQLHWCRCWHCTKPLITRLQIWFSFILNFDFVSGCFLHWIKSFSPIFFIPDMILDLP